MSVTKRLVAAAGWWPLGTAFQRDRQAEVRPCAGGDDSVAEAQGNKKGTKEEGEDQQSLFYFTF